MAEKTAGKHRGKPWPKGTSGNPAGRTPGSRNRATVAAEALLDGQAEAITQKALELALEGDPVALRICLDRIIPPRKDRPIRLALPQSGNAKEISTAFAKVVAAVAAGDITPNEAQTVAGILELQRKANESADLEKRVAALEDVEDGKGKSACAPTRPEGV